MKYLVVFNFKLICNKLCVSMIFSILLSFVIHFFLIVILYNITIKKKPVCINTSEVVTFSLFSIDPILNEISPNEQLLRSIVKIKKHKMLRYKLHDTVNKSVLNSKNILNTDSSCTAVIQNKVENSMMMSGITPVKSENKMIYNSKKVNDSCIDVINRVHPEYPKQAKVLGIEGRLVVMYDVNNLGKIENIQILSATPVGVFERNVRSAMRRWIYIHNRKKKNLIIIFKFCLNSVEILNHKHDKK